MILIDLILQLDCFFYSFLTLTRMRLLLYVDVAMLQSASVVKIIPFTVSLSFYMCKRFSEYICNLILFTSVRTENLNIFTLVITTASEVLPQRSWK